jgi:NACHT domain
MFSVPIFCLLVFLAAFSAYVINQIPALKNFPGRNVTIYRVLFEATALTVCLMALNDKDLAQKYPLAEKGALIGGALLAFDLVQSGWAIWKHARGDVSAANFDDSQQRRQLLDCVSQDIRDRKKANLAGLAVIPLDMQNMPDRVGKREVATPVVNQPLAEPKKFWWAPIQRIFRRGEQPAVEIPQSRQMIDVFYEADRRLLILGKPGAGKTTLLLELAEKLLIAAQVPESNQIPVRLECSEWKDDKQSLEQWLIAQLKKQFTVPPQLSQKWIRDRQLVLLLDGLDELGLERQKLFTLMISAFIKDNHYPELVVCCRQEEFDRAGAIPDGLQGAVYLEPLKDQQICDYLQQMGRAELWEKIQSDELSDMLPDWESCLQSNELPGLRSPLLLNMLLIAKPKQPVKSVQELCAVYVDEQIKKYYTSSAQEKRLYTPEQTHRYLRWIARQLKAENITEFRIEDLQPTWLNRNYQLWLYRLIVGLTWGLIGGLIVGLTWGLIGGLIGGLIFGLIGGLIFGLSGFLDSISTIEKFDLSIKGISRGIKYSLIFGLIGGLIFGLIGGLILGLIVGLIIGLIIGLILGLIVGLIIGLIIGLIAGLIFGLIFGLTNNSIRGKSATNQGIKDTAKNSLLVSLIGFPAGGLLFVAPKLAVGEPVMIENLLSYGFSGFLLIGIFLSGGINVIQHVILRFFLWVFGYAPWDYAQFLAHANQLRLVQHLGSNYRFVHDVVREQIIGQSSTPIRPIPWPDWIQYPILLLGLILAIVAGRGVQPISSQISKLNSSVFQSGDWTFSDSVSLRFTKLKHGEWIYYNRQFKTEVQRCYTGTEKNTS